MEGFKVFTQDSAEVEIYAKKTLGITQYIYETKDKKVFDKLCAIAQKHFEVYYKYASRQRKKSPLSKFLSSFNLRRKTHADLMTALGMVLICLRAQDKSVNIADDASKLLYQMIGVQLESYNRPMMSYVTKQNRGDVQTTFKALQDEYGKIESLNDFTSSPHYGGNHFYLFFEKISELDSLPLSTLQAYSYTEEELLEICAIYAMHFPSINTFELDKSNLFHYFIIALIIRSYCRKYMQAKERILRQTDALEASKYAFAIQAELENEKTKNRRLETKIAMHEEVIQKLQSTMNLQAARLSEKINEATDTMRTAMLSKQQMLNDAEIQRARQLALIHKHEDKIAELITKIDTLKNLNLDLKSMISGLSTNTSHEQTRLEEMNGRKIVVVGGHPKWISKLQLTCPDFIYIGADKLNFNYAILKNAEQIAFCYLHLNHALYRKIIGHARRASIPVGYVKCVNEIFYFFK